MNKINKFTNELYDILEQMYELRGIITVQDFYLEKNRDTHPVINNTAYLNNQIMNKFSYITNSLDKTISDNYEIADL